MKAVLEKIQEENILKYLNIEISAKKLSLYTSVARNERIEQECVYKAKINTIYNEGTLSIDIQSLMRDIINGVRDAGKVDAVTVTSIPYLLVVLDENDEMLFPCLSSRDEKIERLSSDVIDTHTLFYESGLVAENCSAAYQLASLKNEDAALFERASSFMFLSDYIRFALTGVKATDSSIAIANALVLKDGMTWNNRLFESLGIDNLFPSMSEEGSFLGSFSDEISKEVGYDAGVYSNPANAVLLADYLLHPHMIITSYLGGRIGITSSSQITGDDVYEAKGRNIRKRDGGNMLLFPFRGYDLIRKLKSQLPGGTTFDTIEEIARANRTFEYIDIRDERLGSGNNIAETVNVILNENGKESVNGDEAVGLLYNSIARYAVGTVRLLDEMDESPSDNILIIGGAAKDYYLNSLISMHSGKKVCASAGFFSSTFASLYMMKKNGEVSDDQIIPYIKKAYGMLTFRREDRE